MAFFPIKLHIDEEIAKGAEAKVSTGKFLEYPVVIKHRFAKTYRNAGIDNKLRKDRTIKEVRLLQSARELGINVPYVLDVKKNEWIIIMDRLFADPIKFRLEDTDFSSYFKKLGKMVATLHNGGIVHGDLTTSNVFVDKTGSVWLIDFGLGYNTKNVEDFAVDNLVLKHILESSHPLIYEEAFKSFIESYEVKSIKGKQILKRMKQVELRVRYRSH